MAAGNGLGARYPACHHDALLEQVEQRIVDRVDFPAQRIERGYDWCNDRIETVLNQCLAAFFPRAEAERLILAIQKRPRHPVRMSADKLHRESVSKHDKCALCQRSK